MKIGLYFGSFNPIHIGHLIIANYIANNSDLDQVWFVVSPQNPLKTNGTLLNKYHRKYLIDIAIDGEKKLRSSIIEFSLPIPSYTIDTLTYLKEKYPDLIFSVIMGSDSLQNITKWKNYEQLIRNYQVLVYERPGFTMENNLGKNIVTLKAPLLDISSTKIREMIKKGDSIKFLVPDVVKEEIERNHYYK
ncbi:MAG: nicotinic acid mononucleotide adenylyltransferase [Chitinophagaceae bacterium]|nr:nicotinic acid mononucleotide adenylyltransferase [Chitinophagaceae bacterium]